MCDRRLSGGFNRAVPNYHTLVRPEFEQSKPISGSSKSFSSNGRPPIAATCASQRLRRAAQTLDCRTHVRLDQPLPTKRYGLRAEARTQRSHDSRHHDCTQVQATRSPQFLIFRIRSEAGAALLRTSWLTYRQIGRGDNLSLKIRRFWMTGGIFFENDPLLLAANLVPS